MAKATTLYPGTPANGLYLVIQKLDTGYAWDAAAGALEAFDAASLGDYDLPLSQLGGDIWGVTIPAALPAGDYGFTFYEQQGASPATTDPALPSSYSARWSGSETSPAGSGYIGRYTSRDALEDEHGAPNVAAWSNTSGGTSADDDAIERAIVWAEAYIDRLLSKLYAVPLAFAAGEVDPIVEHWATALASHRLHAKRGMRDDKVGGDLKQRKDDALSEMKLYATGIRQLQATAATGAVTGSTGYVGWTDINGNEIPRTTSAAYESKLPGIRW